MPAQQYAVLQRQYYQQAAPQQQMHMTEEITLPADAFPGNSYSFKALDGREITFQVPQGDTPGMVL